MNRKPKRGPSAIADIKKEGMQRVRHRERLASQKLKVGIIDVGLPPPAPMLENGIKRLKERGIELRLSSTLASGCLPLSPFHDTDRKIEAFMEILYDESVNIVIPAYGGHGCVAFAHALRQYYIDSTFKASFIEAVRRKVYVVCEDTTALMLYLMRFGACGFYARHAAAKLGAEDDVVRMIDAIVSFGAFELPVKTISPAESRGRIIGGNAASVAALAFTRLCSTLDKKILYLESMGAGDYCSNGCIVKFLEKLVVTGAASRLKGLIIGGLSPPATDELRLTPWDMLHLDLPKLGIDGPVALLAAAGRDPLRSLIPLGFKTSMVLRNDGRLCLAWVS